MLYYCGNTYGSITYGHGQKRTFWTLWTLDFWTLLTPLAMDIKTGANKSPSIP